MTHPHSLTPSFSPSSCSTPSCLHRRTSNQLCPPPLLPPPFPACTPTLPDTPDAGDSAEISEKRAWAESSADAEAQLMSGATGVVDREASLPLSLLDAAANEAEEDPVLGPCWPEADSDLTHACEDVARAATSMSFVQGRGGIGELDAGGGGWGREGDGGGRRAGWMAASDRGELGVGGLFGKLPALSSSGGTGRCVRACGPAPLLSGLPF